MFWAQPVHGGVPLHFHSALRVIDSPTGSQPRSPFIRYYLATASLFGVVWLALWLALVETTSGGLDEPIAPASTPVAPQWIPTITRTSLLPHPFAGVCMNCHVILGGAPAVVDRRTARQGGLSDEERALVEAGQMVRMPSVVSDLKAPLISRASKLPHSFWGVCSNCHSVVHAGAGVPPYLLSQGLDRARERLITMQLTDTQIAWADADAGSALQVVLFYAFGVLALVMFALSMPYIVMKSLSRRHPERYRKSFNLERWFRIHEWASVGFTSFALLHWLLSVRGNAVLHLSLVLAILLTASGIAYRFRASSEQEHSAQWLHSQRFVTYAMIFSALVGHFIVSSIWL